MIKMKTYTRINILILLVAFILPALAFAKELLNAASVVPEITALGIRAQVEKLVDPRFAQLRENEDKYFLNIKLGRLSQRQFAQLQALYGRQNFTTYRADREYNLIDFLPASMQAVANQVFKPAHYSFRFLQEPPYDNFQASPGFENDDMDYGALSKNHMSSQTNCWNTTIENLNYLYFNRAGSQKSYGLYLPGRWQADDALKSNESSSPVAPGREKIYDGMLLSMVNAGVVGDPGMLQHSAILLGSKIVFEKTDGQENDPYRISLRADVEAKYQRIFENLLKIEFRRYGKAPIEVRGLRNDFSPAIREMIEKGTQKPYSSMQIGGGCETSFGGGCDYYLYEKHTARVVKNPRSERGILLAPQSLLLRFEGLRGQ